ncbi:isochorismatase family protein [Salipaludibacillus agaradhaerens]|jgi:bifunctional isochorismate lyase/aryl carrier protein|uniref:isochorismatase family protein n=1 Tax=Salipaludibacillus agaradhaerens TaxID=76935 RepID=UPI000995F2E8|nr:isochorismatase family protein [Salipaludibacillus agaradhaerens]
MAIPTIKPYQMPTKTNLPENKVPWNADPKRSALLIHDMENYFLDKYDQETSPFTELIQHIQQLKIECERLDIPVIYSAQPGGQTLEKRGLLYDFWGKGVPDNEEKTAIHNSVALTGNDILLTKWRYSAFKQTNLLEILREKGRDQLMICGVYAHIGCLMTAGEAFMEDIQPFMITDAIADFSAEYHRMAITYVAERCGVVCSTDQLIEDWQENTPVQAIPSALPETKDDLRLQVAEIMDESVESMTLRDNLIEKGLDSIRIMSLVEKWRQGGAEVTFTDLAEQPTLEQWWALLTATSETIY